MTEDAVPEADAQEQREPVDDSDSDEFQYPPLGDETPEADAWEQALPVPYDEEDDWR